MINTYTTKVPGCYGAKLGRKTAYRECVHNVLSLHTEFLSIIPDIMNISTDDYTVRSDHFIKAKGLRILSEKPVARLEGNHYVVDVYYTVTWD